MMIMGSIDKAYTKPIERELIYSNPIEKELIYSNPIEKELIYSNPINSADYLLDPFLNQTRLILNQTRLILNQTKLILNQTRLILNQTRLIVNDTDIVYLTKYKPILYNPSTKQTKIYNPLSKNINFTNVSQDYNSSDSDYSNYPTVLMHGILANADNLNELKKMIEMNFKIKVFNLEIGNGADTSIHIDMQSQLKMLCEKIYSIDDLKDGFNFIGMSQGGLLARGYVQYCNKYPVKNLITLVSPNAGVFYQINFANNFYEPSKQKELSLTNYWRDPYRYETYLTNSTYLAKLNHEVKRVSLYMIQENNLDVLDNFVMIWSPNDEIIEPPESAKFSMYKVVDNQLKTVELFDSDLYENDFLKLKTMNEENRLYTYQTDCKHSRHKDQECFHQLKYIFKKFLI